MILMKGLELPMNVITMLLIALIVLIALIALFFGVFNMSSGSVSLTTAKTNACQMMINTGCMMSASSITISNFDSDRDGTVESDGTLLELCANYYGTTSDSQCKTEICGCMPESDVP
jgi:hypothetical protein